MGMTTRKKANSFFAETLRSILAWEDGTRKCLFVGYNNYNI